MKRSVCLALLAVFVVLGFWGCALVSMETTLRSKRKESKIMLLDGLVPIPLWRSVEIDKRPDDERAGP